MSGFSVISLAPPAQRAAPTLATSLDSMKSKTLEGFGPRLAALRQSQGMTQTELGHAAGISQRMVAYYELESAQPPGALFQDHPVRVVVALKRKNANRFGCTYTLAHELYFTTGPGMRSGAMNALNRRACLRLPARLPICYTRTDLTRPRRAVCRNAAPTND